MALTKRQRQEVWGKSSGKCWYCGCDLPEKGWHADHMEPVIRSMPAAPPRTYPIFGEVPESIKKKLEDKGMEKPQNDTIDNIVPACAPCNLFKATFSVERFRREIEGQVERARKSSVNFRTAERFGMIKTESVPVVFWFEAQGL